MTVVDKVVDKHGTRGGGPGLSRVPLLRGRAGDRGEALLPAARSPKVADKHAAEFPKVSCSPSTRCSAAGRRRRQSTSPTAACSTRSTSRSDGPTSRAARANRRPRGADRVSRILGARLPGFGLTLGFTCCTSSLLVLIPLSAPSCCKAATLSWTTFWATVTESARAGLVPAELRRVARWRASINAVFGLLRRLGAGALPFPGPTLARRARRSAVRPADRGRRHRAHHRRTPSNGWIGRYAASRSGSRSPSRRSAIVIALTFIGLPFVVRTVQPVLAGSRPRDRGGRREPRRHRVADVSARHPADAAAGAADRLRPGLRARARRVRLGVFISGNMPMKTEITPLLIITKLEQYDYAGATAIAVVMLVASFRPAAGHQRRCSGGARRHAGGMIADEAAVASRRAPRRRTGPRASRRASALAPDRRRRRASRPVPGAAAGRPCSRRRFAKGVGAVLSLRSPSPMRCRRHPAHAAHGRHRRAAQPRLRRRRRVGDRQVRLSRQERPDHADRSAVRGVAGDLGPDLRAAVRAQGWLGPLARRPRHQDHLRRAGHRAGHASSSPSRSWPAS